jgi:hypothetical protein
MILERAAIDRCLALGLKPEHFFRDLHGALCRHIYAMRAEDSPVDLVTLGQRLADAAILEEVGGMPYLLLLQETAQSAEAVGSYAETVMEKAALREIILAADQAAARAYEPGGDARAIVLRTRERIAAIDKVGEREIRLIPVAEIISDPQEPPPWVLKPIGAKGCVTLVHGAPQRGKSWLAQHVALCVAAGQPLFGRVECQQAGESVIWDAQLTEYKRWLVDRRLAALCEGMGLNGKSPLPCLFNGRGIKVDEAEGYQVLRRLLKERRPTLLAIDALINLHTKDENSNVEMQQVMEPLSDLAGEFDCLVWLNHHDRKGQPGMGEDIPAHSVRGASAILAEVDTAIALRYAAPYLIFHHTKDRLTGRPMESFTFLIEGEADLGEPVKLVYHDEVREDFDEQAKLELQIKAAFENDVEREMYGAQLAAMLHCETKNEKVMLYRALSRLAGAGYLVLSRQEGNARYYPTCYGMLHVTSISGAP